jgi:microcin C transport system substrate-binding protein
MNRQIFYGQYKRIASYFEGTNLASGGLPSGRELELLGTVRDKVPPEVFAKTYSKSVGGNPTAVLQKFARGHSAFKRRGLQHPRPTTRRQQIG